MACLAFLPGARPALGRHSCRGRIVALRIEARPKVGTESAGFPQGGILKPSAWPHCPLEDFWDFTVLPLEKTGWDGFANLDDRLGQVTALCPGQLPKPVPWHMAPHRIPHPPLLSADRCVWFPTRCPTTRGQDGASKGGKENLWQVLEDTEYSESGHRRVVSPSHGLSEREGPASSWILRAG